MFASLFLCPLKRVVRVTSPASLSFAPATQTPLRGLRLSPAYRPGCTLCVESIWRGRPRSRARPCSRAPPLSSPPPSPTQGTGFQPSLGTLRVPPASPQAALLHSGPHLFEDLCALVTPDSLNAIAGDQRVACRLCHSALLLPLDSAQSAAADRRFRRRSADLVPRTAASGQPAGQPAGLRPARSHAKVRGKTLHN